MDKKCLWEGGGSIMKFKFMVEIALDGEDDNEFETGHLQGDIEEALRDYGLNVLNIEAIENETQN